MMRRFGTRALLVLFVMLLWGCGGAKSITGGKVDSRLTARNVIRNHMSGEPEFKTLSGRLGIDYSDGTSQQSVTVSLRMKRDEVIWMSAPLGVLKVYITPNRVSFYNKLQNEYFEGDFGYVSDLLGSEIDFAKLQNLLLGQAVLDLREQRYEMEITEDTYRLKPRTDLDLYKFLFSIEPRNFRLSAQQLSQPLAKRLMEVRYASYQEVQGKIVPDRVHIAAIEQNDRVTIGLSYRQVELNRDLRFPYKVPDGYNPIAAK